MKGRGEGKNGQLGRDKKGGCKGKSMTEGKCHIKGSTGTRVKRKVSVEFGDMRE